MDEEKRGREFFGRKEPDLEKNSPSNLPLPNGGTLTGDESTKEP